MKKFEIHLLILLIFLSSCEKKQEKELELEFHSSALLSSFSCPDSVFVSKNPNTKTFHIYNECRHIKYRADNFRALSSDSVPVSLILCKSCLSILKSGIKEPEKTQNVDNSIEVNSNIEKSLRQRVKSAAKGTIRNPELTPIPSKRNPMNEAIE